SGKPLVVVRKRQYGLEGEVVIDQSTGYSKGEMFLNDVKPGERVVIVDDVLSTGGTIRAIIKGIEKTGAQIMHIITVVEKGPGLKLLQTDYPNIKIESLVRLEMDGANIVILD
ncbi:MAG: phosphoribosyltransferase family protein, partial [Candidatus Poseidoniales archaeon]|nr:phosphoribosyltransferase family protein [Candidatus Poseidoniales archaeon]